MEGGSALKYPIPRLPKPAKLPAPLTLVESQRLQILNLQRANIDREMAEAQNAIFRRLGIPDGAQVTIHITTDGGTVSPAPNREARA